MMRRLAIVIYILFAAAFLLMPFSLLLSDENPTPLEIPPRLVIPEEFQDQPVPPPQPASEPIQPIPKLELIVPVGAVDSPLACPLDASVLVNAMEGQSTFICSGTVVDSSNGESTVLTCAHEFRGLKNPALTIIHQKKEYPATLLRKDDQNDLAVLGVKASLPVVDLAEENPKVGDRVTSVGLKQALTDGLEEKRHVVTNVDRFKGPGNIETDGEQFLGRSGGGLFHDGRLCGVITGFTGNKRSCLYVSLDPVRRFLSGPVGSTSKTVCRLWMAPFHCPPCHRLKRVLGSGNDRIAIEVYTHPKEKLTPEHNFPYVEIIDSRGKSTALYNIESLPHLEKNIDRIEAEYHDPVGSHIAGASINGRAAIESALSLVESIGGSESQVSFKLHRDGCKEVFPLGQKATFQEFTGSSGHVELSIATTHYLPIKSVSFDYKWVDGRFFAKTTDWVEILIPGDGVVGASQPVGSPLLVAYTVLSIAYNIYELCHPTMALWISPDIEMSASYKGGKLAVDCGPNPPKARVSWAFLMGLIRIEYNRAVTGIEITVDNVVAQFHQSRLYRDVNFDVK